MLIQKFSLCISKLILPERVQTCFYCKLPSDARQQTMYRTREDERETGEVGELCPFRMLFEPMMDESARLMSTYISWLSKIYVTCCLVLENSSLSHIALIFNVGIIMQSVNHRVKCTVCHFNSENLHIQKQSCMQSVTAIP